MCLYFNMYLLSIYKILVLIINYYEDLRLKGNI